MFARSVLLLITTPFLFACGETTETSPALTVSAAWVRAPMPNAQMTAGYFSITNNTTRALRIVGASSPQFDRTEIHETTMVDGTMRMRPVARVSIDAGATVAFQPGGQHMMLIGMRAELTPASSVSLLLDIDDGSQIDLMLPVSKRAPNE